MKTHTQHGFTLIELALVISIVGLLLGSAIKGGELVQSAKTKRLASDFNNTRLQINLYQDHFKSLPGDDANAQQHLQGGNAGNGNGRLEGRWLDTKLNNSETYFFWQHLRLANFIVSENESSQSDELPRNIDGSRMGVQAGDVPSIVGVSGQIVMCSSGVIGRNVKQLDLLLDDGNTETGDMRAAEVVDGIIPANAVSQTGYDAINDSNQYVVCMALI